MEKNRGIFCTGNSRHINIRYLFSKYRVDKREVKIEFWPTQMMLEDYFTKSLKGKLFKILRDIIMGYKPTSSLEQILVSIMEHVGNNWENDWNYFWLKKRRGTFESLNMTQRQRNEKRLENMSRIKSKEK